MSAETLFNISMIIAGIGWLVLLILSRFWKFSDKFVIGIIVVLVSMVYCYVNFGHFAEVKEKWVFLSLEGVMKVFSHPFLVVAGWTHIMAFDLMVGIWIKNNAAKYGVHYAIVVPILLVTIMLAPFGLLLYHIARWIKTKQYFGSLQ